MYKNYKVVNVISNGEVVSDWINPLERLLFKISCTEDRLADNYKIENMKLHEHLSFDILLNEHNEIVSFSGLFNGGRYPEGVYRVLNRTWVHESLRVKHGAFRFITSELILPQQLIRNKQKLKLIFVSRERLSGKYFLKRWLQRQRAEDQWQLSENLVQVVPHVEKKSCYQYICFRKFQDISWPHTEITADKWFQLPD